LNPIQTLSASLKGVAKNQRWIKFIFVFLAFFLLAFFLRFQTFSLSALDWDETAYLMGAKSIDNGVGLYFSDESAWDHKPPLIFIIFYLAIKVFGDSILAVRLLGTFAISITAFILFLIGVRRFKSINMGILAACSYIFFTLTRQGPGTNAEIIYNIFTSLSIYFLLEVNQRIKNEQPFSIYLFLTGLSIATAIQVKYNTILDMGMICIFFSVLFLLQYRLTKTAIRRLLYSNLLIILPVFFSFGVFFLYYFIKGNLEEYFIITIIMNFGHIQNLPSSLEMVIKRILEELQQRPVHWLSLVLLPFMIKFHSDKIKKSGLILLISWLAVSICSLFFLRTLYEHYFIQLFPALSLTAAYILSALQKMIRFRYEKILFISILYFTVIFSIFQVYSPFEKKEIFRLDWKDTPRQIAEYLGNMEEQYIYVVNYEPVIYYLTNANIPTKYCFPPFLMHRHYEPMIRLINNSQKDEMNRILSLKPEFIILAENNYIPVNIHLQNKLLGFIQSEYSLKRNFDSILVYQRNP